jgi:hypothetical protein
MLSSLTGQLKRPLALFTLIILSFALAACGSATSTPTSPAPTTLPPTAAPAPTATPSSQGSAAYNQVSFNYDLSLASTVTATTVPSQNAGSDGPYWATYPAYTELNFVGYSSINTYHKPRIEVYPVTDYEQLNPGAKDVIENLKQLLADKPATVDQLPLLPLFNAAQVFHAQLQYIQFQDGQGVRFITQYDQAPLPINNLELFYTFQGLTNDGQYYVAAILPITSSVLPNTDQVTSEQEQTPLADFPAYLKQTTQQLDSLKPSDFSPDLSLLDQVIQSLQVK